MQFSHAQKREIYDKGFVQVPGVIPQVMVRAALRAINASVGQGMNVEEMTKFRSQSYCPEIQNDPVITDLFNKTPAWSLAESAIGEDSFAPAGGGQIALRFPGMQDPPGSPRPHLDGMYSPHNGVPQGTIQNFTMLVGVFLSDVVDQYSGNLSVWPRTHQIYEEYFKKHGPESLIEGMPKVEIPQPEQILAQAGDVVFVHYQVAHGVAPNVSPHTRYAIFFRVSRHGHKHRRLEVMTDIWQEWDGMRETVEERRGASAATSP
jgi:ectoine hydroxylase-related dioxygenase (phytanoyl-CoA dioxygenase family)